MSASHLGSVAVMSGVTGFSAEQAEVVVYAALAFLQG